MKSMKKIKITSIITSLLGCLLGIFLILKPYTSATIICYLLGALLLLGGIMKVYFYFMKGMASFLFSYYELPLGLLAIFAGIIFLIHPNNLLYILPILIGILILVDSIFKLQLALEFRRQGISSWWSMLINFIAGTIVSLILLFNPFKGSMMLMMLIGISLIVESLQTLFSIFFISKHIKRIKPIDVEYEEIEIL
ncbi:MAG: HdeD family acid-resistance protein [Traorella sp.]